jgi:hypothetical protein
MQNNETMEWIVMSKGNPTMQISFCITEKPNQRIRDIVSDHDISVLRCYFEISKVIALTQTSICEIAHKRKTVVCRLLEGKGLANEIRRYLRMVMKGYSIATLGYARMTKAKLFQWMKLETPLAVLMSTPKFSADETEGELGNRVRNFLTSEEGDSYRLSKTIMKTQKESWSGSHAYHSVKRFVLSDEFITRFFGERVLYQLKHMFGRKPDEDGSPVRPF